MCGIAGFLTKKNINNNRIKEITQLMCNKIVHRGPNSSGEWSNEDYGLGIGHRRLSIIDLSKSGHQPMLSHSGRYIISFNGEIYNYKLLKIKLEKQFNQINWRGNSDTEVFLQMIEQYGLIRALDQVTGMFAFSLWDNKEKRLSLVRDRMGEKPLYYGWQGNSFLFASELKAMRNHPDWVGEINRNSIAIFIRHNCIPAPHTIFNDIYKLVPGKILTIEYNNTNHMQGVYPPLHTYWSLKKSAEAGLSNRVNDNEKEIVDELERMLLTTIYQQMNSDVALGSFLSGGIDSSLITLLMQKQSNKKINTFTIGIDLKGYNEAEYAKSIAKYLGTDHTELYVTKNDLLEVVPKIPYLYDEPFADSSQIPTYLLSKLAKTKVTVSLSGDGGDELCGGYNRHFTANKIRFLLNAMPLSIRKAIVKILYKLPQNKIIDFLLFFESYLFKNKDRGRIEEKFDKFLTIISSKSYNDYYFNLISHWKEPHKIVIDSIEPNPIINFHDTNFGLINNMLYYDSTFYLPDDLMVKVDRASMGVSLESRAPFLDHNLIEYSWKIPDNMKVRSGKGKWILREILYKHIPKDLLDRPKMGFGIPIDLWLRNELRDWAEDLINEKRLIEEGYFYPKEIRSKWKEHLKGTRNWSHYLWDILMFQSWLKYWKY